MIAGLIQAIQVAQPIADAMAEFKGLYLPIVWFFAWWLKNRTIIDNGTIPVFVVAMCAVGQCIGTLLSGGSIGYTTVMAGAMWGVVAVGGHSGFKNVLDLVKRIKLGRG